MKLILRYLKRYKGLFILNVCSVFGFALVELGIPTIISDMIDNGVMYGNTDYLLKMGLLITVISIIGVGGTILLGYCLGIPTIISDMIDNGVMYGNTDYLLKMGLLITVISIIGVGGTILLGYCCAKISTSVTRDIRNDVFEKVQSFSHHEMNQFGVASLITRTNNDAFQIMNFLNIILRTALLTDVFEKVQSFSHHEMNQFGVASLITRTNNDAFQIMNFLNIILRTALLTPVMIIVSFSLTIAASLKLSLIIASTVPVIIIGVLIVGKVSGPISERQQKSLDASKNPWMALTVFSEKI